MKYFEIKQPYYALIKAEDKETAREKYIEAVCDEDEDAPFEFNEVSREYASKQYANSEYYTTTAFYDEAIEEFNMHEPGVLLVDTQLC